MEYLYATGTSAECFVHCTDPLEKHNPPMKVNEPRGLERRGPAAGGNVMATERSNKAGVALAGIFLLLPCNRAAHAESNAAVSSTTLRNDSYLNAGAHAMMRNQFELGVQLTHLALEQTLDNYERATALSNLCAGYAQLKKFATALAFCNQSIILDKDNWRAWLNRAAAHMGTGMVGESMQDVTRGLALNPEAPELQLAFKIISEAAQHKGDRHKSLVNS